MKKFYFTLVTFLFLAVANAQIVNIPDANFKAKLLALGVDTNGDTNIDTFEAIEVTNLELSNSSISSLSGIESFTSLISLGCSNNQIASLYLTGLNNLQVLACNDNQMLSLELSNLNNLATLYCHNNQLGTLNVSGLNNLVTFLCYNNQLTSINVSGLLNLKYLLCSNNLLSSIDLNGLVSLSSLYCENNQFLNLNLNGLFNLNILKCENNQLTILDISELYNLEHLECFGNQLISLNIKNGNIENWYLLSFFYNPNLLHICADESDINLVQSKINQYGYSATCQVNSYCSFTPGGTFYTIQGNQRIDSNNNGCNTSDPIFPNLKFNITNGTITGSLISNTSGNFSIPVQAGTHTITPQFENPTYFTANPTSATVTFPTTTSPFIQDFCIAPNGIHHDLEVVVIPMDDARPGFDANYKIKYKNKGNQTENTIINFNYNDAILDFVSSSVAPTTQATGTLSWNVGTISPFQSGEILVTLNVNSPMETPAVNGGDVLSYTATANGLNTDETPDDNTFTLNQVVVNSFDPNDKTCLEGAIINPSNIGKYVHYKIRFENTGTFAAQNIVVKDMIDTTKFDITTLQITDASHSCITRITNPNKVEFIFENINLPFDDANNDGYVVFKIKTKPTLVVGNTISNSANIYFDYNFPIVTNTATSTFSVLQNDTFEFDNYFTIYPNPIDEVLNLNTKQYTEVYSLTIYNLLGQQVQTTTNPTNTVDVSSLKTGNYIVKVVTGEGVSSSKFVKE
ncbi:MAG: T9SS type A sorting domain-containing protein [Flavobacterium sp.]|uniref:DUF7619 domain-containing protein n=1 Tax=Flavobacterium sp. TaxID=239 RepID=UPI0022BB415E|nr:T9SS type A sorting domain-containing protein [Flavobacterium sp.]MCZ8197701.1 T9SS type A sorting domain-containing protein [Flavobacterium sp.]